VFNGTIGANAPKNFILLTGLEERGVFLLSSVGTNGYTILFGEASTPSINSRRKPSGEKTSRTVSVTFSEAGYPPARFRHPRIFREIYQLLAGRPIRSSGSHSVRASFSAFEIDAPRRAPTCNHEGRGMQGGLRRATGMMRTRGRVSREGHCMIIAGNGINTPDYFQYTRKRVSMCQWTRVWSHQDIILFRLVKRRERRLILCRNCW